MSERDQVKRRERAQAQRSARTPAPKLRRSFALTAEAVRRLEAHALGLGVEPAELVERFALGLRRFVLVDRGGGAAGGPAPEGEGEDNQAGR